MNTLMSFGEIGHLVISKFRDVLRENPKTEIVVASNTNNSLRIKVFVANGVISCGIVFIKEDLSDYIGITIEEDATSELYVIHSPVFTAEEMISNSLKTLKQDLVDLLISSKVFEREG